MPVCGSYGAAEQRQSDLWSSSRALASGSGSSLRDGDGALGIVCQGVILPLPVVLAEYSSRTNPALFLRHVQTFFGQRLLYLWVAIYFALSSHLGGFWGAPGFNRARLL